MDFDPDQFLEDAKQEEARAKYGGALSKTGAGIEALARGATLSLSDVLERAAGVPAEDIEGRQKALGSGATALEIGGAILPAVLSGGASAPESGALTLGRAAEALPAALVPKLGGAVTRGLEAVLPEAETLGGKLLTKAVSHGVAGGIEGGLYGAGQVVHEAALGDPNLTAQSALEEVGLSAGLGGLLGAGTGVASGLFKGASDALGKKLADWLPEFEGERNLKVAGAIQSDITQASKRLSREELNKIGREAGEMGIITPLSSPSQTLARAEEVMESSGKKMGDILESADAAAKPRPIEDVVARAKKDILEKLERNPLEKATARQFGEMLDGYEALHPTTEAGQVGFKDLHNIRKQVSDKLYGLRGTADPQATELKNALGDFRRIISDEINAGMDASGFGSDAWKAANREYQVASTIEKFAQKGVDRAVGNNLVSPTELLSGLAGLAGHGAPGGLLMGLGTAAIRRHGSGVLGAAARGIRGALEGAAPVAETETTKAIGELAKANKAVAKRIEDLTAKAVKGAEGTVVAFRGKGAAIESEKLLEERMRRIGALAGNPDQLQQAVARQTDDIHEHAPNTSQALAIASSRKVAFLASKLPRDAQTAHTPLAPKPHLSGADKWTFGRYYEAVNQPTSILTHAANGTLTPQDVEAVKQTSPALYDKMRTEALKQLAAHKEPLPYARRLMLAMLLGQDVDGTLTPQAIQANQMAYQRPSGKEDMAPQQQGAVKPSQSGLSKLKVSNHSMLPSQSSEARRGEL